MDFVITVRAAGARWPLPGDAMDLRIRAGRQLTVEEFSPLVADALGMPSAHLRHSGFVLAGSASVGSPPLVHGASLLVSSAASTPAPDHRSSPQPTDPAGGVRGVPATPFEVVIASGPDCGMRAPLTAGGLVLGRCDEADLLVQDAALSRRHVRFAVTAAGVTLMDQGSTNGVTVDGTRLQGEPRDIDRRSRIGLGHTTVQLRRPAAATSGGLPTGDGWITVPAQRNVLPAAADVTLTRPRPPDPAPRSSLPWITMLVPLPIAVVLAVVLGPQFLLFALLGPVTMGAGWLHDRRRHGRRERDARAAHHAATDEHERAVATALATEALDRDHRCPDPATVLELATAAPTRIWGRDPEGPDFLHLRLGWGRPPSRTVRVRDADAVERPVLAGAPVTTSVGADGPLRIVGAHTRRDAVIRQLVGQVVVTHSPDDVSVHVLTDDADTGPWSWCRWLPHVDRSGVGAGRSGGSAARRYEPAGDGASGRPELLVVPDLDALPEALRRSVLELVEDDDGPPAILGCTSLVARPKGTVLRLLPDGDRLESGTDTAYTSLVADGVGPWWAERVARALAPLRPAGRSGHSPVSLWDAAGPRSDGGPEDGTEAFGARVGACWSATDDDTGLVPARALVGETEGGPWWIDLDEDGPHVLIGGTTGSGKSEVLRALLLGLAAGCPPEQVTFLLVDYKGGATFTEIQRLPHTVGVVSDLDPALADRALRSLRAEVRRREELFATVGATDLVDFRGRPGAEPVPRLVVVVDEFRVLAEEHPAFLTGLVRLAAVGRSMGIHLVLATQRPAGAITPDIQANVNLRIALRMRDTHDSDQVIASPAAARISQSEPGAGFARSGDGQLVPFRAFHVTRPHTAEARPVRVAIVGAALVGTGMDGSSGPVDGGPTEEQAFVDCLLAVAAEQARPRPRRPWVPPLPGRLEPADVRGSCPADRVPLGLVDLPDEQTRVALSWAPTVPCWRVVGGPGSGRTSALLTLLTEASRRFGADDLEVYAVTARRSLAAAADLPIVGAVVDTSEIGRLRRLARLLAERLQHHPSAAGSPGRTLLVVDDWDQVMAMDGEAHAVLAPLVRELVGAPGAALVAAGGRVLAGARQLTGGDIHCLGGLEVADLLTMGIRPQQAPATWGPGRAVRVEDRAHVQFALPDPAPVPRLTRRRPPPVLDLPRQVDLADVGAAGAGLVIGVTDGAEGAESAEGIASWDAARWGHGLLVCGPGGSGRTSTLLSLARQADRVGRRVVVVNADPAHDWPTPPLALPEHEALHRRATEQLGALVLVDDADRLPPGLEAALVSLLERAPQLELQAAVAVRQHTLATAFRGVITTMAAHGCGLLLNPRSAHDGEPFGLRIEPPPVLPGRGVLITRGRTREIQVALADEAAPVRPSLP